MLDEAKEDKPKEMAAPIVLGVAKKAPLAGPEGSDEGEGEADMSEDEFHAAMDVKAAFKHGDDDDFAAALKNFVSICGGY